MAVTYFKVVNNSNKITITDSRQNYWLSRKIKLSTITPVMENVTCSIGIVSMRDTGWRFLYKYTFWDEAESIICAYSSESTPNVAYHIGRDYVSNSTFLEVWAKTSTDFHPQNVYVFVFTPTTNYHSSDKFGLEIRNAAGLTIFHSSDYTLDVVDWKSITGEDSDPFEQPLPKHTDYVCSIPTGKRYAMAPMFLYSGTFWGGTGGPGALYPTYCVGTLYFNGEIRFAECTKLHVINPETAQYWQEEAEYTAKYRSPVSEWLIVDITNIPLPN